MHRMRISSTSQFPAYTHNGVQSQSPAHIRNGVASLHAGSWIMVDGPELSWTEGDRWHAKISLPSGSVYEYKYVVLDSSGTHALTWQRGNNSVLAIQQVHPLHS